MHTLLVLRSKSVHMPEYFPKCHRLIKMERCSLTWFREVPDFTHNPTRVLTMPYDLLG